MVDHSSGSGGVYITVSDIVYSAKEQGKLNLMRENTLILHCMKKTTWEERKNKECWGKCNIEADGFIHCSTVEYFWRVAPNFNDIKEEMVLVCIDENKLNSEVRYEDGDNCGREYPHVYGLINNDAIIKVLPFLRNEDGTYIKNPEFADIQEK